MSLLRLRLRPLARSLTTPPRTPPSLESLLASPSLLALLATHSSTPTSRLPESARVAVAAHLATSAGAPLPSPTYAAALSASDMAVYFARDCASLRPAMPPAHGMRLAGVGEAEVAAAGGVVAMEFPGNLTMDERIFEARHRKRLATGRRTWAGERKDWTHKRRGE